MINNHWLLSSWWSWAGWGLKCYTGLEGDRWKTCDLHRGFRTCYTKYDPCSIVNIKIQIQHIYTSIIIITNTDFFKSQYIVLMQWGRWRVGAVQPRKRCTMFTARWSRWWSRGWKSWWWLLCQAHEMEELEEKFCYCSFNYCNTAIRKVRKFF